MTRHLRIAAWNANGLVPRKNELHFFATDLDVDVILVSETHLQPYHTFSLPAYQSYRTDRPHRPRGGQVRNPGGGTAVLIHRRLTHHHVPTQTTSFESTAVAIHVGGTEVTLVGAYVPPNAPFSCRDFDSLLSLQGPVIIGGDLNAKHQTWNSRRANPKGVALSNYLTQRADTSVLAPVDPTHFPANLQGTPDVLDIFLLKDVPFPTEVKAVNDLSSDHIPVLLTVHSSPTSRHPPHSRTVKTDWARYCSLLSDRLVPAAPAATPEDLDSLVSDLHGVLAEALASSSKPSPPRDTRKSLPPEIIDALAKRRRLRRAWQRTRNPETRRSFNRQCQVTKLLLNAYRSETWDSYLLSLDIDDGSAWKAAKTLRGIKPTSHPLHGQRGLVYSACDKAEAFADTMEDQFQPHPGVYNEAHEEHVTNFMLEFFVTQPQDDLEPFSLGDIQTVITQAKPRKAPGYDLIGARALQAAPPSLLDCLLSLFNSALRLRHFPAPWKKAKIILIPKPNKSHLFPQNYRPISLLPIISKLFEKLFLTRISPYLDGYLRPEQFGFRKGHSTTLQLVRVVNKLVDAANNNLATVAVLLDVSKAFDRVWHAGLLYKLSESPVPDSAVHLLHSYISGRSFQTSVEGEMSSVRPVGAGVPQGSVLGPILYLLYANDMPTVPGVTLSLYADDAMYQASSLNPTRAAQVMQVQMDALSPWLERWRIAVNTDKSEAIIFKKFRRMPRAKPDPVTLDGEPIAWKSAVKYLGVTIDSGLTFTQHAQAKVAESRKIRGLIHPLISRRSPLPVKVKTTIFLLIVRSILLYASTAWWALTSRTNRNRLEACQSIVLRRITGMPWFVRNSTIRTSLNVPSLGEFARSTAATLFQRAEDSGLPHFVEVFQRDGPPERHRPRPRAILDDPP